MHPCRCRGRASYGSPEVPQKLLTTKFLFLMLVFLLKMIILGCEMGVPPFQETPMSFWSWHWKARFLSMFPSNVHYRHPENSWEHIWIPRRADRCFRFTRGNYRLTFRHDSRCWFSYSPIQESQCFSNQQKFLYVSILPSPPKKRQVVVSKLCYFSPQPHLDPFLSKGWNHQL